MDAWMSAFPVNCQTRLTVLPVNYRCGD